jgi:hypothetical protein
LFFKRVALGGLEEPTCDALASRLRHAAPDFGAGAIALVDSPRWPRDFDWSRGTRRRNLVPPEREIDAALRHLFRSLSAARPNTHPAERVDARRGKARMPGLSMFPTPRYGYFARCARDPRCKPHLKAIAAELFGALARRPVDTEARGLAPSGGAIFTRFMLAGFATYCALELLGVLAFESYPDLQLRLLSPSAKLPPKSRRAEALAARRRIVAELAIGLKFRDAPVPANLDQADAAALALAAASCARRGALWVVGNRCEGRFMLALDARQARQLAI